MGLPVRFVAVTYNLWATNRWPEREPALRSFLRSHAPDILCVQELRDVTRAVLDEELPTHARIDDSFEGWTKEGNIYWLSTMFEMLEYGAENIGQLSPLRRLFWARLQLKGTERTLFVSTVHFTWQGNPREKEEGFSPRLDEARRSLQAIQRLASSEEPVLFMGDLNDQVNAIRILRAQGLADCFTGRGAFPVPTIPARPTAGGTPQTIDWQFYRGPIRPMTSEVLDYYEGDFAPSDHKPLIATHALV
ncbi:MAG: endonuclease/exonuclease/phosphatase family protein [Limnochordia bacterium]|jgi:endonuclease/exonuclease/phosphatase (EEP) superfamily protein YafD